MSGLIEKYISLVDEAQTLFPFKTPQDVQTHYAKEIQSGAQNEPLYKIFHRLIHSALALPKTEGDNGWLIGLKRNMWLREGFDVNVEPYDGVIRVIFEAVRAAQPAGSTFVCKELSDPSWIDAINAARALLITNPKINSPNSREMAVITGIKFLRNEGYNIGLNDVGLFFHDGESERLVSEINTCLSNIGGRIAIEKLFEYLRGRNQFNGTRYLPGRYYKPILAGPQDASLPVGYLLNLAARHCKIPIVASNANSSNMWQKACDYTRALCAIYDVEPHNNMESLSLPAERVPQFLADNALFDHLFTFTQWNPEHAKSILSGIFKNIDQDWMLKIMGWTIADMLKLLEITLNAPDIPGEVFELHKQEILASGIDDIKWQAMKPHFVHDADAVNQTYQHPRDSQKVTLNRKPLIECAENIYIGLPLSLAVATFFDAVDNALRSNDYPQVDKAFGDALEKLVPAECAARGYSVSAASKKYKMKDMFDGKAVEGECDIVLETINSVIFIETKKKKLTSSASSGEPLINLIDLSDSLLHGQCQAGVHERLMRQYHRITFEDGSQLHLKGRSIERIVVTLLDHGSTQDRALVWQIYRALAGAKVNTNRAVPEREQRALRDLNKRCQKLALEMTKLEQCGINVEQQNFNLWFMSVPQLLDLLDNVPSPSLLQSTLGSLRTVSFRLFDMYRELHLWLDIQNKKISSTPSSPIFYRTK